MIITIDGPAGTGKSSVAQLVAERLGFDFLDTGAMYRAVALEAVRRGTAMDNPRELSFVARHAHVSFDWLQRPPGVLLNGERVSHLLRSGEVTRAASQIATIGAIREMLVSQQRAIGAERNDLVSEGRDQGTVVFPDADLKFYIDAAPAERARRRAAQLRARGEIVDPQEILRQIVDRDHRDASRAVGPLAKADDARVIDTTCLSQEQVIEQIVEQVHARMGQ